MKNKKIEALVDNVCRSVLLDFECENNDGNMLEVIWNFLIRYIVDDFNDELNNNFNKEAYEYFDECF